jgi:hypothetical protein
MESIKNILQNFDPLEDKYISREFQAFGCHLAEKLQDTQHKALYIRLAKTIPRPVLEEALRFVVDSKAKSKGGLFMWKLKQMDAFTKMIKQPRKAKKKAVSKEKKEEIKDPAAEKPVFKTTRKRKKPLMDPLF